MSNRREGDITYEHLEAMRDRLEDKMQRDFDALTGSMVELKNTVLRQNGRIGKSEDAIAELRTAFAVMKAIGLPVATAAHKALGEVSRKKVVAAAVAALLALASALEVVKALGDVLLKMVRG